MAMKMDRRAFLSCIFKDFCRSGSGSIYDRTAGRLR